MKKRLFIVLMYYRVRTFGVIPLITTPLHIDTRPPGADVAAVYTQIISDLQQAKKLLGKMPAQGKPTTYSASICPADVYLTMAGWPLKQISNSCTQNPGY